MLQGQSWVSKVHELQGAGSGRLRSCCSKQTGEPLAVAVSICKPNVHKTFMMKTVHAYFSLLTRVNHSE